MAAYVIAIVDVKDAARYDREYVPAVLPLIEKHGGKPLVVTPEVDAKEGRWPPGRTIIIEFPDQAAAEAWYSDEAYRPLLKLRGEISEGLLAIAEGL